MPILRIAGGTVNQTPLDWKGNLENIVAAIESARRQQARLLCLPELCITAYGCEDLFLSQWLPETAWSQLLSLLPHCQGITVSVGLPVVIEDTTYNAACLIDDGKIQGLTLKQHLAREGVHYEPRWFKPWPRGKVVTLEKNGMSIPAGDLIYELHGIRIGYEICEDGWSGPARPGYSLCERGIDLILNPSASHFAMGKSQYRETEVVVGASGTFSCVYMMANLLGNEAGRMVYDGDLLVAQNGRLLAQDSRLSFDTSRVMCCDVDFADPERSQQPVLLDDKDKNEELARALSLALFDYLRKSRTKGFVLSLSGGADSGCCAVMVSEMVKRASTALGWGKFCTALGLNEASVAGDRMKAMRLVLACAYQATTNSSEVTFHAARSLADEIGAEFFDWSVDDVITAYTDKINRALGRTLSWSQDDVSLQNIQARARSPIIWMLANVKGAILLTTSNRSEGDVGYATMDGDTSGSLAPIAGLSKPFILQWLRWAMTTLDYPSLKHIVAQQPTAELRPLHLHQTDEADLMPYDLLLQIELLAIRDRQSPAGVYKTLQKQYPDHDALKAYVRKFFRLWSINQWKRERMAPSIHLDDLNVDPRTWCRFPILSAGFREELENL